MRYLKPLSTLAISLAFSACISSNAPQLQAVQRGHAVAAQWCSGCHRISRDRLLAAQPEQSRPQWANAPSFMEIADNPRVDRTYLHGLASEFFFPMPAFHLDEKDQEDVISYILSLKGQP